MRVPHSRQLPLLLLTGLCSLLLTLAAWVSALRSAEAEARAQFERQVDEVVSSVRGRLLDYEQVLRGAAGLFAASENVSRAEWHAYAMTTRTERMYPGIVGLGYVARLPAADLEATLAALRADGAPAFRIFPEGARAEYAPVVFLEPDDAGNRRAIGYDMAVDPARRAAMDRARDSGTAAISRAVRLVQDRESAVSAFLMFVPVFRPGADSETVTGRRAGLAGYVAAGFRFAAFFEGSVGPLPGLDLRLEDITEDAAATELYRSGQGPVAGSPRFTRAERFRAAQRLWRLEAASRPSLEAEVSSHIPVLILASGLAITALLMLVVWSLTTTRERAREIAGHMTTALRASEERLQLALRSSRLALFDWDVPAGLVQLSAEWPALLGAPAAETLTPLQKLRALDHPDDVAAVEAEVRRLVEGEADACRFEHRVRRADGGWLWIETTARVNERGRDGRALRVTGANADITERKAMEGLKDEFIATVNHELRTPLTSIVGSLSLLREGAAGELPPEARGFVEIAHANVERLAALVNDILDLERIGAGGLELEIGEVAVDRVLAHAVELNAPYAKKHGASYVPPPASGLRVRADEQRLLQVLTNLLSNAAKHSPPGGAVVLGIEDRGAMARISVRDQGKGIPEAFRARLFGKFEQGDRSRGGTGLGLAISKALVERMQGRIGCDSEPGRGACFWFELPKA